MTAVRMALDKNKSLESLSTENRFVVYSNLFAMPVLNNLHNHQVTGINTKKLWHMGIVISKNHIL